MKAAVQNGQTEAGAFPFPLVDGPRESPFVSWLRNHSNFMAGNGLPDVLRMVAVLVRGIAINALILLPRLLLIALALGIVYGGMLTDWDDQRDGGVFAQRTLEDVRLSQREDRPDADWATLFTEGLNWLRGLVFDHAGQSASIKADMANYEARVQRETEARLDKPIDLFISKSVIFEHTGWTKWMQHLTGLQPPFLLTPLALLLAAMAVLIYPVHTTLSRIAGYKLSLAGGTENSLRSRDSYERIFSLALALVLAIALFELLPRLIYLYSQVRLRHFKTHLPWKEYLGTATLAIGALSGVPKLLASLSGRRKNLAMFVISLFGVLAPLCMIVVVSDFLLYQPMSVTPGNLLGLLVILVVLPSIYAVVLIITILLGLAKKTFSAVEYRGLIGLLIGMIVLHAAVIVLMLAIYCVVFMVYYSHPRWVPDILLAVQELRHPDLQSYGDLAAYFVVGCALEIWLFVWLTADVNLTSIHGHYRDRLASTFLLRVDAHGEVDVEEDIALGELSRHSTGSVAPYHLINAALNVPGSKDVQLRDRRSDSFVFSKMYIGGERTGYCRSATMEQVFPQISLASAMAISAAAAAPNMGRYTSRLLAPLMTLINIRFGVWVPNPGLLEERLYAGLGPAQLPATARRSGHAPGFNFAEVFHDELDLVVRRWMQLDPAGAQRSLVASRTPTAAHGLAGLAFSGGGVRSTAINLGIAQVLHRGGLFPHFDYLSTVSGGGYIGSGISARMRYRTPPASEIAGTVLIERADSGEQIVTVTPGSSGRARVYRYAKDAQLAVRDGERVSTGTRLIRRTEFATHCDIAGTVSVELAAHGRQVVRVTGDRQGVSKGELRDYHFTRYDRLAVGHGERIGAHDPLVVRRNSFSQRFAWRVRPRALLREMTLQIDEFYPWVNVSDGGHIENLATIELLRRRCKYIVVGDCEKDGAMHFYGLSTLLRTARIDLGVHIDINVQDLSLDDNGNSRSHFAIGRITYPGAADEDRHGYLLYLKSTCSGDEDAVIGGYRNISPSFPHESTADQFFNEGQFVAYRALGQHIAEQAVAALLPAPTSGALTFVSFCQGFETLWQQRQQRRSHEPE